MIRTVRTESFSGLAVDVNGSSMLYSLIDTGWLILHVYCFEKVDGKVRR